jgi:hypothetical protein
MTGDARTPELSAELPRLAACLTAGLRKEQRPPSPDLLDGSAGAALALHSLGTSRVQAPSWDGFLALA